MNTEIKIVFRTSGPLSQRAGMEFWSHGTHFTSVAGRCTYQFTTTPEVESLQEGVLSVISLIEKIVAEEDFMWDSVVIDDIKAKVIE